MKTNFDSDNILSIARVFERNLSINRSSYFDSHLLEELILHYIEEEQLALATRACDTGMQLFPFSSEFLRLKAKTLAEARDYDHALELVEQSKMLDGESIQNCIIEAEILTSSDRSKEAEMLLHEAFSKYGPNSEELLRCKLQLYEKQYNYSEAFEVLREFLLSNPSNDQLMERIHLYTEITECYRESIQLYKKLTDKDPYSTLAWYNLGSAYLNLNHNDLAVESFEFAMVINPEFEMAHLDCAEAYYREGMYEKVIEVYQEYLEHFCLNSDVAVCMGSAYKALNRNQEALDNYLKALKLNPLNHKAHYQLGKYYLSTENWMSSKDSFLRAIEINPTESDYYASLGISYFHLDEITSAQETLEKSCDLAPDECYKWIQYAIFLIEVELPEYALEIVDQAYMYCNSNNLDFCKAACLFTLGRRKEAFVLLREALSQNSENVELLYQCQPFLKEDAEVVMTVQDLTR